MVQSKAKVAQFLETFFMYRYFFLDVMGMILLGIAFFKNGIFKAAKYIIYYIIMMISDYGVGLTINYFETSYIVVNNFDIVPTAFANLML